MPKEEDKIPYPKPLYGHLHRDHLYEPFYDEHSDFNTNAKSYFDYLARFNRQLRAMTDYLNGLSFDVKVLETDSIILGVEVENEQTFVIQGDSRISTFTDKFYLNNGQSFNVPNALKIINNSNNNGGLFSPNYQTVFDDMSNKIKTLEDKVENLTNTINNNNTKIENLERGLQQIINNLYNSSSITSNNINNYTFKSDRSIATGNINFFGGVADGTKFIRTNSGKTENDIVAGY